MLKALALFLILPGLASAAPLIAARTLPAGTVLTREDLSGDPDEADGITGLETRVTIFEGKPVRPAQLVAPTLINRNQLVTISFETPLLSIEAEGRALQPGGAGDSIRVMNLASRVTVTGEVRENGTILVRGK